MAPQNYKIIFKDGATQTIKASRQYTEAPWLVFQDDETEVLRVPTNEVRGVQRGDVTDREYPGAVFA